jgi:hypothetical protein
MREKSRIFLLYKIYVLYLFLKKLIMKFRIINNIHFEILHEFKTEINNISDSIVKLPNSDIAVLRNYHGSNQLLNHDNIKCKIEGKDPAFLWRNSDNKKIWLKYHYELLYKLASFKRDYKIECILIKEEINIC